MDSLFAYDAGHLPMFEVEDAFTLAVEEFLA